MKITRKQIRKLITEVRMANGGGIPVKSRANSEFAAIIKGQQKLNEYSDYASHVDLADSFDDISSMIEDVLMKYVESGWLEGQDQNSLAVAIEDLFTAATRLSVTFNSIAGR